MKGSSPFFKYWLPVFAWITLIFVASTDLMSSERTSRFIGPLLRWFKPDLSEERIKQVQLVARKGAHLAEYAILGMLLWRALHQPRSDGPSRWDWRAAGMALLTAALYAVTDEFHQSLTSSRFGSGWDVTIDTAGAAMGLALVWGWGRWRQKW